MKSRQAIQSGQPGEGLMTVRKILEPRQRFAKLAGNQMYVSMIEGGNVLAVIRPSQLAQPLSRFRMFCASIKITVQRRDATCVYVHQLFEPGVWISLQNRALNFDVSSRFVKMACLALHQGDAIVKEGRDMWVSCLVNQPPRLRENGSKNLA